MSTPRPPWSRGRSIRDRPNSGAWLTVSAWACFFLLLATTAVGYTHEVNYSGSGGSLAGSESARAAAMLGSSAPAHSSLLVVVETRGFSPGELQNATLSAQSRLDAARLDYYNGTQSVYSSYAELLDHQAGPELGTLRSAGAEMANLTGQLYGFPASFLAAWGAQGATLATINSTYRQAGGAPSGYEEAFRDALIANYTASSSAAARVQAAVVSAAPPFVPSGAALATALHGTNVTSYGADLPGLTTEYLAASGGPTVPVDWVRAALTPGDFGSNFVAQNGVAGAPPYLVAQFVSPDGSVALLRVLFSVPESFRTSGGGYPAQEATPTVRAIAEAEFGGSARVTGPGAAAYDAQQLEASAGILFALTFVFLGVAVAVTLRSWIAPLLALLLVALSTLLGYLAIDATGLLVGRVDVTVTYTLTAVTLGVATDYALFLLYRYREELARGRDPEEALTTAMRSSRFAILVSAMTVAVGLGSLSFLSGLATWGPVLFLTVLAIGLLEVTLLPALVRLIGPRLFARRWLRPAPPPERSPFYRVAARSSDRPWRVAILALLIAVPSVAGFLLAPTSYNFSTGLAGTSPSAQGQAWVEQSFGANVLYPTYVIVTAPTGFLAPNGSLTGEAYRILPAVAEGLLAHPGVQSVVGPFVDGRNVSTAQATPAEVAAFTLRGGTAAYFVVESSFDPYSPAALALVGSLRGNGSYLVGGVTSSVLDQKALDASQFPVLELLLTALIAVLLGVAFRSVALPVISVSGVLLSITSTTALLYLIATYLLRAPLLWLLPLIVFVILMSLGNDYTVFLLARIREEQGRHGPREGLLRGIAGSGVVVSALGVILAVSLGSLALQPIVFLQELGIAFVISLLLDTFVVRPFYFPAMLTLADRRSRGGCPPAPAPPAASERGG